MASKALVTAVREAWAFFLAEAKKVPSEARYAITSVVINQAVQPLVNIQGDLNSSEKQGLEDIITKFKLQPCTIAGCKTEKEASTLLITAIGKANLSLDERKQAMEAILRVLRED
jgi:hypothetical protein